MNEHEGRNMTTAERRETEREARAWARERAEQKRAVDFRRGVRAYRTIRALLADNPGALLGGGR